MKKEEEIFHGKVIRKKMTPCIRKFFEQCDDIRAKYTANGVLIEWHPSRKTYDIIPRRMGYFRKIKVKGKDGKTKYVEGLVVIL